MPHTTITDSYVAEKHTVAAEDEGSTSAEDFEFGEPLGPIEILFFIITWLLTAAVAITIVTAVYKSFFPNI